MNYYALVIGIIIAIYVVIRFRRTRLEKKKWVYPAFLATFPVYYWVFAISASDNAALMNELAVGLGFLIIAYIAYKSNSGIGLLLLVLGYILHALYDVLHNSFFHNAGTPSWWPEFCGAIDMLIGLYLIYLVFPKQQKEAKIV